MSQQQLRELREKDVADGYRDKSFVANETPTKFTIPKVKLICTLGHIFICFLLFQ